MKNTIFIVLSSFIVQSLCQVPPYGNLCFEDGCSIQGQKFPEGSKYTYGCSTFICKEGNWTLLNISKKCESCFVERDPNIKTFDNFGYVWNGYCNYSLSQPFDCSNPSSSYNAPYGIYSDFDECRFPFGSFGTTSFPLFKASCVGITTYKVNKYTAVAVVHSMLPDIFINNNIGSPPSNPTIPNDCSNSNPYPVLVWKGSIGSFTENCVFVAGPHYTLVACTYGVTIFTIPGHFKKIAGLCGNFTYAMEDDWLSRTCVVHDETNQLELQPFAESWETDEQLDQNCVRGGIIKHEIDCEEFRTQCEETVRKAFNECGFISENLYEFAVNSCINDCCTDPNLCKNWQILAYQSACIMAELSNLQSEGGKE